MSEFRKYLKTHPRAAPPLPLVHSTLLENFDTLAAAGELTPQMCPVFNKPLTYCFYGRPAYRSAKKGLKPSTVQEFMPVCFVFKPSAFRGAIDAVYPFDTGAASGGRFRPHVEAAEVADFGMGRSLNAAARGVTAFYEGNRRYFESEPKAGLGAQPYPVPAVQKYVSLITLEGETDFDDRRSTFEIMAHRPVRFENNLLAVIAPRIFLERAGVRDKVEGAWGARALAYSSVRGTVPAEYVRTVTQQMSTLMEQEGML